MKKNIFILAIAAVLISTTSMAQIILNKSDMPQQDDTVRISVGINPGIIDLSETGANHVWDYSGLIPFQQRIDTFVSVTSTPAGLLFMFTSDFAVNMAGAFSFPGTGISQPYLYYKSTNSAYQNTGFAFTMDGFPIPAPFSDPDILYQFPLTYPHADSSNSGVDMNLPGTGYLLVDRHRTNTVDGWGTLTTPYGTFDVIRIKSEVTEYDSVYLDSQETGFGLPYSYTEYKWMGKNQKAPLLLVRDIAEGVVVEYTDSIRGSLGVNEKQNIVTKLAIYPNPVKSKATLRFNLKQKSTVEMATIDMTGKKLWQSPREEMVSGLHEVTLDALQMNLKPGHYFLQVRANNRTSTVKFVFLP